MHVLHMPVELMPVEIKVNLFYFLDLKQFLLFLCQRILFPSQVTTGGTESIFLVCKAYRDYAKYIKGIKNPNM